MDGTETAQLGEKVDEIRGHLDKVKADGWNLNEATTENIVIGPILQALGYGPLDIYKQGHDNAANNFPDYTLFPNTPQKWFLEVKKLDFTLKDAEAAQAVNYAANQGAEWAVLTNGRKWFIYNAHLPKPLPEKRVFQIGDLFADASALKTLAFLSRVSMLSGGLSAAWTFERVQGIVKAQLEMPNSAVRKQLRKIATEETKATVSEALIEQVLRSFSPALPIVAGNGIVSSHVQTSPVPQPPVDTHLAQYTFTQIGADNALGTGKKPMCLHFSDGTTAKVTSWADAGIATLTRAVEQFGLPPLPFNNRAKGKTYFLNTQPTHSTGKSMKAGKPAQVNGITLYIDTNRSAQDLASSVNSVLKAIGAPVDFVKVSIK